MIQKDKISIFLLPAGNLNEWDYTVSSTNDDKNIPKEAIRPPRKVVICTPILFVRIPAKGDMQNVVPSCKDPTRAVKNRFNKNWIQLKTYIFTWSVFVR